MPHDGLRRFQALELRRFLESIDAHLDGAAKMILLGGSAIALGYQVGTGTSDVDTFETDYSRLADAIRKAQLETGLNIPVANSSVADAPYHYTDRLQRVLGQLTKLEVFVLERHDLALSKALRCEEHDLAALVALHQSHKLELDTLVARYIEEMGHAMGHAGTRDLNLVVTVERLFGEMEGEHVRKRLSSWRGESR